MRAWASSLSPEWPSSSGTAEDRNASISARRTRASDVAVVLRDGGGSQHRNPGEGGPTRARGRRPPGRRRIATPQPGGGGPYACAWPSSSGTAEDRNCSRSVSVSSDVSWPSSSGTAEDRNLDRRFGVRPAEEPVAVVLRDGGGSQLQISVACGGICRMWPSSSGTAEDRNRLSSVTVPTRTWWPSSSGTAEDRNAKTCGRPLITKPRGRRPPGRRRIATVRAVRVGAGRRPVAVVLRDGGGSQPAGPHGDSLRPLKWPSSSGTAEDRNRGGSSGGGHCAAVAVVLRDGGGSQRMHRRPAGPGGLGWPSSSGTAEDRNRVWSRRWPRSCARGRRPPGRRRIATRAPATRTQGTTGVAVVLRDGGGSQRGGAAAGPRPGRLWPSSSGTAEDRNSPEGATVMVVLPVAVVLRDGGGSQLRLGDVLRCGRKWPSSSGTAEDRNPQLSRRRCGHYRAWPSSSGTAEDRNPQSGSLAVSLPLVAVVLRDGGGSQPMVWLIGAEASGRGRRPPGRRRIAT